MLIDKMSVFYKNWFTHNIIHLINDLLNEHSNFYKFYEFKAKYNFDVPFTVFYGLIDAIPNAWKDKIKRQNQNGKVNQNDNTTFNTSQFIPLYYIKVSGIASGNKLIKTIRYPHM